MVAVFRPWSRVQIVRTRSELHIRLFHCVLYIISCCSFHFVHIGVVVWSCSCEGKSHSYSFLRIVPSDWTGPASCRSQPCRPRPPLLFWWKSRARPRLREWSPKRPFRKSETSRFACVTPDKTNQAVPWSVPSDKSKRASFLEVFSEGCQRVMHLVTWSLRIPHSAFSS